MYSFKKNLILIVLFISSYPSFAEVNILRLAVTTTTENSGLITLLNPVFEEQNKVKINTIVTGSGQALRMGEQGDVDVLLTHSPDDEEEFINSGYGLKRHPVMHNNFILVGPQDDPAKIKNSNSIEIAFKKLSESKQNFISRGDSSGTYKKELSIWKENNITPVGEWYIEAGLGMGAVLQLANQQEAYTLTDYGTFIRFKDKLDLYVHHQGDPILYNPYHIIAVNPDIHQQVNYSLAKKYIEFITGDEAKKIINDYKLNGKQLFYTDNNNDAKDTVVIIEKESKSYFIDAIVSSFKLIINLDSALFQVVLTSLSVSLIAVLIATCFSIPLGVLVALNNFTGKNFLLACLNTLMALPTVVVGLLLYGFLNRQGLLGDFGLLYTPTAMVIGQCILIIPIIWNLCIAAVNSADPRLDRMCSSLSANYLQRVLIYMSEVRFALIAAVVTGFGRAIGEVGIAMMLGGNIHGYTRTMTTAIALETSKGDFEFALALGFMLLLVAFIVNTFLQQFQLRIR